MLFGDTICAPATAAGDGGIAIVRISGENAFECSRSVFFGKNSVFEPRKMYLGEIRKGGELVDKAMMVFFPSPFSYTGEDVCELHCHGGRMAVKLTMEALLENGARIAEPGEFSKRAFLNGKIDITQAEAVAEMISSLTESGAKVSARQLRGDLKNKITELKEALTDVIASIEAGIEYPEEEEEQNMAFAALPKIERVMKDASALESTFEASKLIREGVEIAIAGRPNVGKSSLLNAILGEERAIVASVPGTTRDTVSEYSDIHGIPVRFTDTAGIRDTGDEVEKIGVERTRTALGDASAVLFMLDASCGIADEDRAIFSEISAKKHIIVLNKSDAAVIDENEVKAAFGEAPIIISAKNREGIDELLNTVYNFVCSERELFEGAMITNLRQKNAVSSAVKSLSDAFSALSSGVDLDCVSIDLSDAWRSLCEITGEALTEDIVDRIFEKFCLGK